MDIDVDIDDQSHGHRSVRASISSLNGVPPQTHAPLPTDSVEHIRLPPIQDASQHVIEKPIRGVQKKKPKPIRVLNTPEDRMEILDGLLSRAESSIAKPTHAPRGPRQRADPDDRLRRRGHGDGRLGQHRRRTAPRAPAARPPALIVVPM